MQSYDGLSEGDSPVVRWNAMMPVRMKPFFLQSPDGTLKEQLILKTPSGEHYAVFVRFHGDGDNRPQQVCCEICERRWPAAFRDERQP